MSSAVPARFNIRVYGIWIRGESVLLSHEQTDTFSFTKFPGGGLQLGEGIADCLQREFMEELQISVEKKSLFFVNEDFLQSAFLPEDQMICMYYKVHGNVLPTLAPTIETRHGKTYQVQAFWKNISELKSEDFYFPLDKKVAEMLLQEFSASG